MHLLDNYIKKNGFLWLLEFLLLLFRLYLGFDHSGMCMFSVQEILSKADYFIIKKCDLELWPLKNMGIFFLITALEIKHGTIGGGEC